MTKNYIEISLPEAVLSLLPVIIIAVVYFLWLKDRQTIIVAALRMLGQLILVGYLLNYIFRQSSAWLPLLVALIMLSCAAWIALGPVAAKRKNLYVDAFIALGIGALPILAFLLFVIIRPKPWFLPNLIIPLTGMCLSNSMNTLSLAAERFFTDFEQNGLNVIESRNNAFRASLIPAVNMFLSIGLVSLPGLMTGQILAGIEPSVAIRYQILIMSMVMSSGGCTTIIFLSRQCQRNANSINK